MDRGRDIADVIRLDFNPTKEILAQLIVKYGKNLRNVRIPEIHFHNIPKSRLGDLPLDPKKIAYT